MPKKIFLILMVVTMMLAIASCSGNQKPDDDTPEPAPDVPVLESSMPILDNNGVRLGEIDSRANCTAADHGIFYSVANLVNYQSTGTAEYHFFNKEDKTDVLLGKLENQGYEAYYTRTESDGRIYTLAVQGTPGEDSSSLLLLEFDPVQKTMKTFTVSENGFPYADMAAVNGKLLIMSHETSDKIYEFDPADETMKEALSFSSDQDSLRGICNADEGFWLLRLKINNDGENEMFVDLYDDDYTKKSEQSVNEAMISAIATMPGMTDRSDALNETGMNTVHFSVIDGRYMFYENLSVSRIIIDLQSGDTLLAKDDLYSVSPGSGRPVMFRMDFDSENAEDPEIIELKNGQLVNHVFKPTDSHKLIRYVSTSDSGTWLVMTSDTPRSFDWTLAVYLWTEQN